MKIKLECLDCGSEEIEKSETLGGDGEWIEEYFCKRCYEVVAWKRKEETERNEKALSREDQLEVLKRAKIESGANTIEELEDWINQQEELEEDLYDSFHFGISATREIVEDLIYPQTREEVRNKISDEDGNL